MYVCSYVYEHIFIIPFAANLDIGDGSSKQKHSVSTGAMTEFAEASQTTNRNGWFARSIPLQTNAMVAIYRGEYSTVTLLSQWCSITSMIQLPCIKPFSSNYLDGFINSFFFNNVELKVLMKEYKGAKK